MEPYTKNTESCLCLTPTWQDERKKKGDNAFQVTLKQPSGRVSKSYYRYKFHKSNSEIYVIRKHGEVRMSLRRYFRDLPPFNFVWQACGWHRSLNYDDQGNWHPMR